MFRFTWRDLRLTQRLLLAGAVLNTIGACVGVSLLLSYA